jgi:hypothetical protein
MTANNAIYKEVIEDILMASLGVAVFLLHSGLIKTICLIALIIIAAYSCFEGVSRIVANYHRLQSLREENKKLKDSLSIADINLKEIKKKPSPIPEPPTLVVDDFLGNTRKIQDFISGLYGEDHYPNVYKAYFKSVEDLNKADKDISIIKNLIIKPFTEGLGQVNMPLSKEDTKKILFDLVSFALMMFDFVDTYRYSANNYPEQLLSVKVATGKESLDEASAKAKTATILADETPKYIRAIKAVIESLGLEGTVLYSGYKL